MSNVHVVHKLIEEDIIEHEESMDCLCTPYVADTICVPGIGGCVVIAHRSMREGLEKLSAEDA